MAKAPLDPWRSFNFFEKELLVEEDAKEREPSRFFQSFTPSCSSSGRGHLVFGDSNGRIHIVNRDYKAKTFQPFEKEVIALHQLKRSNVLAAIGNDAAGVPSIKIFWLDKEDNNGDPAVAKTIPIFGPKSPQFPVTCFAVLEDLSQLAVGLESGGVRLIEGHLLRDRHPKSRWLVEEGHRITGLAFAENARVSLFVVTSHDVRSFYTKDKRMAPGGIVLNDEDGAELQNSVLSDNNELVVAQKVADQEAIMFYQPEDRGICFGFEGHKTMIGWFKSYLWMVRQQQGVRYHTLTIYDLKNKFIAFSAKFDTVVSVVSEWGSLFVVTAKKNAYQLSEKDLPTKMNVLFGRSMYSIAIALAKSQQCDESYIADIFQRYGDHLYTKGDFDGAMQRYLQTISYCEPSYVIRKFLHAQRIHNLTRYLEELHTKGKAHQDHTTLLLNCYTKLKDTSKLNQFVMSQKMEFDVQTAITVLRQAAYYHHALYLAQIHNNYHLYLQIQLEDVEDYAQAIKYIATLEFADAKEYMMEYGKKIVDMQTKASTQLLISLCTGYRPKIKAPAIPPSAASASGSVVSSSSGSSMSMRRPRGPNAGDAHADEAPETKTKEEKTIEEVDLDLIEDANVPLSADVASADDFIHFFVGKAGQLKKFLESVVEHDPQSASTLLYNTLLELYMREGRSPEDEDEFKDAAKTPVHQNADKIIALLKSPYAKYDVDHALVLTKMYGFERGVTHLYEKLMLYNEIVQYHMERDQRAKVIKACHKYGGYDHQLWIQALTFFAGLDDVCEKEIAEVLHEIDARRLLPPLMVVQILSRGGNKPLCVLRDYIIKSLDEDHKKIEEDQDQIQSYQKETQNMRQTIEELTTTATAFQSTNCDACPQRLEPPVVHFLCKHSFHETCLAEPGQCRICGPKYNNVIDQMRTLKASASKHDQFFKQLDDAKDGFSVVAEYFGRGIFQGDDTVIDDAKVPDDDVDL